MLLNKIIFRFFNYLEINKMVSDFKVILIRFCYVWRLLSFYWCYRWEDYDVREFFEKL